jgi:hypothetical protein
MAASFAKARFRHWAFVGLLGLSNVVSAYSEGGGEALDVVNFYAWSVHTFCAIYALIKWGGIWKVYAAISLVANIAFKAGTPLSGVMKMAQILG